MLSLCLSLYIYTNAIYIYIYIYIYKRLYSHGECKIKFKKQSSSPCFAESFKTSRTAQWGQILLYRGKSTLFIRAKKIIEMERVSQINSLKRELSPNLRIKWLYERFFRRLFIRCVKNFSSCFFYYYFTPMIKNRFSTQYLVSILRK